MTIKVPSFFQNISSIPSQAHSGIFEHAEDVFRAVDEIHTSASGIHHLYMKPVELILTVYGYGMVALSVMESLMQMVSECEGDRLIEALVEVKLVLTLPFFLFASLFNFDVFSTYVAQHPRVTHKSPAIATPPPPPQSSDGFEHVSSLPSSVPVQDQHQKGGLLRTIYHAAQVAANFFQILWGGERIPLPEDIDGGPNYNNLGKALLELANNEVISDAVGDIYKYIQDQILPGQIKCCVDFLTPQTINFHKVLPKVNGERFVAIPVVLRESPRDHNVQILVDLEQRTLEYVNPNGSSYENDKGTLTTASNGITLEQVVTAVCQKYNLFQVVSNARTYQMDGHNCGVYALLHLIRRCIDRYTWNQLQDLPFKQSLDQNPMEYRRRIIDLILHHLQRRSN